MDPFISIYYTCTLVLNMHENICYCTFYNIRFLVKIISFWAIKKSDWYNIYIEILPFVALKNKIFFFNKLNFKESLKGDN